MVTEMRTVQPVVTTRLVLRQEVVVRRRRCLGRRRIAEEVRTEAPRLDSHGPVSVRSPDHYQISQFKEE